jgi:hypothetical protein
MRERMKEQPMTSGFTPDAGLTGPPSDPTKHVNYTLGMILGVDEFTQEFAYLSERDRWAVRDLAGYGTLWGLALSARTNGGDPEISITPGVAVSPSGRLIRVTPSQCASINGWLKLHDAELAAHGLPTLGTSTVRVYAVLGYRECETDLLPIPGEPCRSEADTVKASRITDDFRLELRLNPPEQHEEDAVRDVAAWLRQHIEPNATPGSSVPLEVFRAALRAAVIPPPLSPPGWPPFSPASPPDYVLDASPAGPLSVYVGDLHAYLREAFRIWVTELRPLWRPNWLGEVHSCSGSLAPETPLDGDSLLLAEIELPLTRALGDAQWFVEPAAGPDPLAHVAIREDRRPWLLSTRMLQEWQHAGDLGAGPPPSPSAVLHPDAAPAFSLLAAGWLPADPAAPSTGYNGLKAVAAGSGEVAFTFNGISDPGPNSTGNYAVNVTLANPPRPAPAPATLSGPSLVFAGFRPATGSLPIRFVVSVADKGVPLSDPALKQLFFMLQVSRYQ